MIFIKNFQQLTDKIDQLTRLKKRLNKSHPKYPDVCHDLDNFKAGLRGEQIIYDKLRELPQLKDAIILSDIRIFIDQLSTQIDLLVLTRSYALVIEVKNWTGTLHFKDSPRQVIQQTEKGIRGFDCPLLQAETSASVMGMWLERNAFRLPVVHAVVFTSSAPIMQFESPKEHIYTKNALPLLIQNLSKKKFRLQDKQLQNIVEKIERSHVPFMRTTLMNRYQYAFQHLRQGLLCNQCENELTRMTQRKYVCEQCGVIQKNPYEDALLDWLALIDTKLTNYQFRLFTKCPNRREMTYILMRSGLKGTNASKNRVYYLE